VRPSGPESRRSVKKEATVSGVLRRILLRNWIVAEWSKRGYFHRKTRRQRVANYVFKLIFGVNGDVPWSVHFTTRVTHPQRISFGEGVERSFMVSGNCYIQAGNGIEFGSGTMFGPGVKIISANHDSRDFRHWLPAPPIRIGERCWIGANAVILPGVNLGDRVVVGAGAVVTRDVPAGRTVVGNPARDLSELREAK